MESSTTQLKDSFKVRDLSISFGGLKAVSGFSLYLKPKCLHGLIGPNGAGKTTVFNLITGVYVPDSGEIRLGETLLNGFKPYQITKAGLARTFQNIRLFKDLTVLDNVLISLVMQKSYGYWDAFLRSQKFREAERLQREEALSLLEIVGLAHRQEDQAKSLSYGNQRRLEIARALATHPKVLFLDEPAAGLNTREKGDLMKTISDIRDRFGLSILVIEHDMKLVMGICEEISVLDHGETIAVGTPEQIQSNPKVIQAYLGDGI